MKNMSNSTNPASDSTPMESSESKGETHSTELVSSLPNDIFVYRQDVVSCRKYKDLLGVVLEVAGDAESEGSMTDDSDNEDDDRGTTNGNAGGDVEGDDANETDNGDGGDSYDSLPDGQVRVVWTDGSETEEHISDISVVDRSFLHGDFVASASDPTGQMGLVVDVEITVDLQTSSGELMQKVSSKDLKRVRDPVVGDYVVNGPWLGRVDDVLDSVTVLFDDGAVCKVVKADPMRLKPNSKLTDESCPYYPGQRVKAVSSSVFKSSRWLSGLWKANRLEGTVIKVQAASVIVYWIASAYLGIETNSEAVPSEEQDPKNLTVLSCFSYANWQLEDWCHLASSGSVDASKSGKEHVEGPTSDNANSHVNSSTNGSNQVFDIPVSVLGGQGSAITNPEADPQHETSKSSDTTMSGDLAFNSEINDSVTIDGTVKSGGNNETEPKAVLPECGSSNSSSSVLKEPSHDTWPAYRKKLRKFFFKRDRKAHKREDTFDRALFIVNTATKVDVAWQDGTKEYGLDSKSLIPIHTPSDHEFFPEQYVVEKVSDEDDESSEKKRVGVVRNVNSKERTVNVRWFKAASRPEDPREFDCDEIVSAYELEEHPDYDYCYGDVVVRLSPVSASAEQPERSTDLVEAESNKSRKHSDHDGEELAKNDASANFSNLSWVGNISGLVDGDIEVTWADGMVSKVGPQAVFVVGREDGDSFDGGSEISDDGASWETVEEDESGALESTEKEHELQNLAGNIADREKDPANSTEDNNAVTNGPLSMPLAAIGFVTRFATGLFSRGRKQYDLSDADDMAINETEPMDNVEISGELENMERYQESEALDDVSMKDAHETAEKRDGASTEDAEPINGDHLDDSVSVETNAGVTKTDCKDDPSNFKHFDISENPLDHFYLSSGQNSVERKWVKKVHQEWNILEKNLPDDIYVRVFEDRMDLVRAVIIGACGTPYQDGLFFFDFLLPPDYPQVPPSAYYHSGGLRVNPNLYVDGKVCLSLLNTWTGKGNEVWDPSSSSILQVLVSLQGLVLNSKPYFNEAGYEKQVGTVEGEKNSLPYNENTYLLNLKSMLYLLRRPPMHFEGFVRDHFRRRGHYILKACEAYMEGRTIGSLTEDACTTEKSEDHPCSTGFKLMLAKILPRLISALTEVGVDCRQFETLHQLENHTRN